METTADSGRGLSGWIKSTRRFAELMMDTAVSGAMQGKTMEAAGESMGEGPTAPHPFAKAQVIARRRRRMLRRRRLKIQRRMRLRPESRRKIEI